jgi:fused signal recognition particle receptor
MSWLGRLKAGLTKSSSRISDGIAGLFKGGRAPDADALAALEDVLIAADLGPAAAAALAAAIGRRRFDKGADADAIKAALADEIAAILAPVATPLTLGAARPHVVLVVGVNGSGKTTTIGKLAAWLVGEGKRVSLAAGDTFRAAAIDQLRIWGARAGVPVAATAPGADAAGLAFEALEAARRRGDDALLIDTAGRLQNKAELMAELAKIRRVLAKLDPTAPHATLLVLDATIGQNAFAQVEAFRQAAGVTGLVVTKLDGTAKGGVVVGLAQKFALPIHAIGVGESAEDLRPFAPDAFARSLVGLDGPGSD